MSTNWYTTWTGGSSGNGSSCYNNDSNQNDGYEYGGENFSIGNNVGNFISNRGGFNLGYGATENYGNFRRKYEARYGEGAVSNNGENYSDNFRGGYGQRYGDNASSSSNDRSNYRRNYVQTYGEDARGNNRSSYRGNYEQRYGEDVRSNDSINSRGNYEQRYGEDTRSNNRSSYRENYGQRYGENVRSNDSINSRRNYEQRSGENVRSNDSINSRGSYEQRYGEDTRSNNRLSSRKNYGQRYGEDVRSNDSINSRRNYEQRYGENVRSNDSSNYRGSYEQRYGENVRSNDSINSRGNYEQRYEENVRSNDCANYSENFRGGFKPSFGENARDSHCGINYTGINRERYNGHERRTDSDWSGHYYSDGENKVEESYSSKKSIQDCLLEGSVVVVKQQRGRPKYQCLHCKITFFNEDHIEKKGHLGHVEHCLDVRDCFEATVGKRGFGLNFKKLSSQTNESLKSQKVKTEPYQNAYEKDYIEKNIKEESEGIKQEAMEKDFRCNLGRLKEMTSQERVQNYVTNQIKEEVSDIDVKREIIKTEIAEKNIPENNEKHHVTKEEATNLAERQAQEKKKEPQKRLKEIRKILKEKKKKKMAEKNVPENNEKHHVTKEEVTNLAERQAQEKKKERQKRFKEIRKTMKGKKKKKERQKRVKARKRDEEKDEAIFDKEVKAVTRWDQYACLKPECLETFQVWGDARRHMRQGCLPGTRTKKRWRFTVKPNMGQSREKAQNQRGMGTSKLKPVPDENEEKLVEAARNFYAEKRNRTLYPTHKQVVWHLRNTYRGFGVHPARIHQIVKSLSNP